MILRYLKLAPLTLAIALLGLVLSEALSANDKTEMAEAEFAQAASAAPPLPLRRSAGLALPSHGTVASELRADRRTPVHVAGAPRPSCTHLGCAGHIVVGIGF